jgi:DNA excision repair protein ERCC-3
MDHLHPLIVQSDRTLLLEVNHPMYEKARDELLAYAEIVKSPEHVHTYRLTRLTLWNAAALGWKPDQVIGSLSRLSRFPIPSSIRQWILEEMGKYGMFLLMNTANGLRLTGKDQAIRDIARLKDIQPLIVSVHGNGLIIRRENRGELKRRLARLGYPVKDLAGYERGASLDMQLLAKLRPYQQEAVDSFFAGGPEGGSGVIVLPCGAGKTVVALGVMERAKTHTLVVTPNVVALRQWISEAVEKLHTDPHTIGEYSSMCRNIRPITVTTYQMLTYRHGERYPHFETLNRAPWGLIVYDEVHLLPAPVFRLTASLQGRMRLGLTATLVREDGAEEEVFSLIGPKKYDVPWREMENQGWIAKTSCYEVTVPMEKSYRLHYLSAPDRTKYRIAAENPVKLRVLQSLLQKHRGDRVLIVGQYVGQLHEVGQAIGAPVITGKTPVREREHLYAKFRKGDLPVLVVSKVANVALDLPDTNVAIQISGTFGSRQEEAQRLGRLLRPNRDGGESVFYSLVTKDSIDAEKASHRQLFLTEQGYQYILLEADELEGGK